MNKTQMAILQKLMMTKSSKSSLLDSILLWRETAKFVLRDRAEVGVFYRKGVIEAVILAGIGHKTEKDSKKAVAACFKKYEISDVEWWGGT